MIRLVCGPIRLNSNHIKRRFDGKIDNVTRSHILIRISIYVSHFLIMAWYLQCVNVCKAAKEHRKLVLY